MSHLINARYFWGAFHKRYTGVPLIRKELLHDVASTDSGLCNQSLGNKHSQLSTILVANSHMDKRVVYNCMIWLTLEQRFVDEYEVSTRQLRVLFTYWFHVCWLRFRSEGGYIYIYIKQRAPTMNKDQGYHLPAIYNQIILPKFEPTHVTPICE